MKKLKFLTINLLALFTAVAQAQDIPKSSTYVELGAAIGPSTFSGVGALYHDWNLGKRHRLILGTGIRFTGFSGQDINFITAPAELTENDSSIDTLFGPTPILYSINLTINLGFRFTEKLETGFSIDAAGVSFGPNGSPTYIRNGRSQTTGASPTSPNLLLVGDNDRGSLNSIFYVKYRFGQHFGAKVGFQYLFNELTTTTKVQTIPEANDRFRYKSSSGFVGLNYTF